MIKYNYGDSISGRKIVGWAGIIYKRGTIRENNILLKKIEFRQSAECLVDLPITLNKPSSSNDTEEGLIGFKISGKAERCSDFKKVKKTGGHTQWKTTIKGNASCFIDIPITSQR